MYVIKSLKCVKKHYLRHSIGGFKLRTSCTFLHEKKTCKMVLFGGASAGFSPVVESLMEYMGNA